MPREPRPEVKNLARLIKAGGFLDELKREAVKPEPARTTITGDPASSNGSAPKSPEVKGTPSRYEIIDGDQTSIEIAVKNIQTDFGIKKPITLPSEDYSATRKAISNLVPALKKFQARGGTLDPAMGFDFGTGTHRVDSDITPDKVVKMYAGASTDKILKVLVAAHDAWGQEESAESNNKAVKKLIEKLQKDHLFVGEALSIDSGVLNAEAIVTLKTLDAVLADPEISELIKRTNKRPLGTYIGHRPQLERKVNGIIIPRNYTSAAELKQFIRENIEHLPDVRGGSDMPLGEIELPEAEVFDTKSAIEYLKKKHNVNAIEIESGVPEDKTEQFLEKLDEALDGIPELSNIFPLFIKIRKEDRLEINNSNQIEIGIGNDPEQVAITINGDIEEFKKRKAEHTAALVLASQISREHSLGVITHYKGYGELGAVKKLEDALRDLGDAEFLRGLNIRLNSTERVINLDGKELKIPYRSTGSEIEWALADYKRGLEDRVAAELAAAEAQAVSELDALLAGGLGEGLTELKEVSAVETEPIPGRMYQERNGNLFIVYDAPDEDGDFTLFNVSTGHREFSDLDSFAQKVTSKNLELVQASKVDLTTIDAGRAERKKEVEKDIPSSVRRPEHQDFWISYTQQELRDKQEEVKQKIADKKEVTPEDIEELYKLQREVGIMRQIRREYPFKPSDSHIVYYRDTSGSVYDRQEALSRITVEPGMSYIFTIAERREHLDEAKKREIQIGSNLAQTRTGSPEHLFYSEKLSYNQLLQEELTKRIYNPPEPPESPPTPVASLPLKPDLLDHDEEDSGFWDFSEDDAPSSVEIDWDAELGKGYSGSIISSRVESLIPKDSKVVINPDLIKKYEDLDIIIEGLASDRAQIYTEELFIDLYYIQKRDLKNKRQWSNFQKLRKYLDDQLRGTKKRRGFFKDPEIIPGLLPLAHTQKQKIQLIRGKLDTFFGSLSNEDFVKGRDVNQEIEDLLDQLKEAVDGYREISKKITKLSPQIDELNSMIVEEESLVV